MSDGFILKSQASQIFEEVRERGFDPAEFKWAERASSNCDGMRVSALEHASTGFYFTFDLDYGGREHFTECSPGPSSRVDRRRAGTWEQQTVHAGEWLDCLKRELKARDFWTEAKTGSGRTIVIAAPEDVGISRRLRDMGIGAVLAVMLGAALAPDIAKAIFTNLVETIRHLSGGNISIP